MFNKELVLFAALIIGGFASTQGFPSFPDRGLGDEHSTPNKGKRAKIDHAFSTPGQENHPKDGIQIVEEDPAFLAALDELMSTIEKKPRLVQPEQDPDFDLACTLAVEKASADYAARAQALGPSRVVKELFPDEADCPLEPQQKKRNLHQDRDDEPLADTTHEDALDDEDDLANAIPPAPAYLDDVAKMGLKVKLMANVYSGKLDASANIFVPQYVIGIALPNGSIKKMKGYFKTDKGQICVFASGGTQDHWEKSVSKVYSIFFGQKVKIVRWHWLHKQLNRKLGENNPLNAYVGNETELHSELYYSLFFRHFFLPKIQNKYRDNLKTLGILAFSWWEICDTCDGRFRDQKTICEQNGLIDYSCEVAAVRKYTHTYADSIIRTYRVAQNSEVIAWQGIWERVSHYVNKFQRDDRDKRNFWTKTVEGLELCKWLGQAFRENLYTLSAATAKPSRRGDILNYYTDIPDGNKGSLLKLLDYLREENWELSCWYMPPYYNVVQGSWKAYAKQVVRPHFGWQLISEPPADGNIHECQMCGQKGLINTFWVYHPKFRVTNKYFNLSEDQRNATEHSLGITHDTTFDQLPAYLQFKRRQSIVVGSECLKTLELGKSEVEMFRQKMSDEERQARFMDMNEKHNQEDELKAAESKSLLSWMIKKYEESNKPISIQQISRSGNFGIAADIHPLMAILIENKQVKKVGNKYVVLN